MTDTNKPHERVVTVVTKWDAGGEPLVTSAITATAMGHFAYAPDTIDGYGYRLYHIPTGFTLTGFSSADVCERVIAQLMALGDWSWTDTRSEAAKPLLARDGPVLNLLKTARGEDFDALTKLRLAYEGVNPEPDEEDEPAAVIPPGHDWLYTSCTGEGVFHGAHPFIAKLNELAGLMIAEATDIQGVSLSSLRARDTEIGRLGDLMGEPIYAALSVLINEMIHAGVLTMPAEADPAPVSPVAPNFMGTFTTIPIWDDDESSVNMRDRPIGAWDIDVGATFSAVGLQVWPKQRQRAPYLSIWASPKIMQALGAALQIVSEAKQGGSNDG